MNKKAINPTHVMNVGVMALAREVGLSGAAVSKKLSAGQTPAQIRRDAAARKGIKPPNPNGPGRPAKESEYDLIVAGRARVDEMEEAKLRRQKALAERQEIENMVRRGELVPLAYARKWMSKFLIEGRDELLKGPSELQDALAAESDPLKVNAMVRGWLERAIAKFEQMRTVFDADEEAARVA